jgi:hypothetical protein
MVMSALQWKYHWNLSCDVIFHLWESVVVFEQRHWPQFTIGLCTMCNKILRNVFVSPEWCQKFYCIQHLLLFPLQMSNYLCNSECYKALTSIIVSLHIELVWNQFLVCGHWPGNKLIRRFQLIGYVMKILGRAWRLENKKWSSYSI